MTTEKKYSDKLIYAMLGQPTSDRQISNTNKDVTNIFEDLFDIHVKKQANKCFTGGILIQSINPYKTAKQIKKAFTEAPTSETLKQLELIKSIKISPNVAIAYEIDTIKSQLIRTQIGSKAYYEELLANLKIYARSNFVLLGDIFVTDFTSLSKIEAYPSTNTSIL